MSSSPKYFDLVLATSTTTGTGTYTLGSAVTGYQSWAALGNGNSAYYCAQDVDGSGVPSGGYEVGIGTYTSSGTTLSRDKVLASSNSGSAVSWSAGTRRISLVAPAVTAMPSLEMGGRLTTESGIGVSTSDRTAQSTLYYTPYVNNRLSLWDGSGWRRYAFTEISLSLSITSGSNYDVFVYDNAGTLTLELSAAWTNNTTPADTLTTQDGVAVKSSALTRRWVGTIRASGTNVTADSRGGTTSQVGGQRFVWNAYNQVYRPLAVIDTTDAWNYTSTTMRQANGASGNKVEYVVGSNNVLVYAKARGVMYAGGAGGPSAAAATIGVGVDSTTTISGLNAGAFVGTSIGTTGLYVHMDGEYENYVGIGYHYIAWNESGDNSSNTNTLMLGDNGGGQQAGLFARVWG
jgi:hypothetical protein